MTRVLCSASVVAFVLALCLPTTAQELRTEVTVKIPSVSSVGEFDQARVVVNGKVQTTSPGSVAQFNLPAKAGDNVVVQVKFVRKYLWSTTDVRQWQQAVQLNGSGHVEYTANLTGEGIFGQWPFVTFQGSAKLDVWVDSVVKGTTEIGKGVSPNQNHIFEWKKGNSTICSVEVTLPVNVKRTFQCNAATKKVEEP